MKDCTSPSPRVDLDLVNHSLRQLSFYSFFSFFSPRLLSPCSFSNPLFIFHSIPFFSQLTSQLH
jgi:hypothetical protein